MFRICRFTVLKPAKTGHI